MPQPEITEIKQKLTLTEVGVIASIITSILVGTFSVGVFYGQVQDNTEDIAEIKPKVEETEKRIERIDANVSFLAELARENRAKNK